MNDKKKKQKEDVEKDKKKKQKEDVEKDQIKGPGPGTDNRTFCYLDCKIEDGVARRELTGYFRDGVRRVDLVLVLTDTRRADAERAQTEFLMAALDIGFELELEFGMMVQHRELVFVKVHTPARLIEHYGRMFGVHKPFRHSRIEFMQHNWFLLERIFRSWRAPYEREWLALIKSQYPGPGDYTTLERSRVAHRLMQLARFGEPHNHVGLDRLVSGGLVLDVFPLHEGPHFMLDGQRRAQPNGRQVLYLTWTGRSNMFFAQPLNIIREYMGERVGFLFALFEVYVLHVTVPCGLIIQLYYMLTYILPTMRNDYTPRLKSVCKGLASRCGSATYTDFPVCPKCPDFDACPFRHVRDYCDEYETKLINDVYFLMPYSLVVCVIMIVFYYVWRRYEHYLYWLWEVREDEDTNIVRPEYLPPRPPARAPRRPLHVILLHVLLPPFFIVAFVGSSLVVWTRLYVWLERTITRRIEREKKHPDGYAHEYLTPAHRAAQAMLAALYACLVRLLEPVAARAARVCARAGRGCRLADYARAHALHLFIFTVVINFTYLLAVTAKGVAYTYPGNAARWHVMMQWPIYNCGLGTCFDDLMITVQGFLFGKLLLEVAEHTLLRRRTDYGGGVWMLANVPCWEREYCLPPVDDDYVTGRFNTLVIHLMLATFFSAVYPTAPVLIIYYIIYELRQWGEEMLLRRRRPLLVQTGGLGPYNTALFYLPYIAALYNSATSALHSAYFDYEVAYRQHLEPAAEHYLRDFLTSGFHTWDFDECLEANEQFQRSLLRHLHPGCCVFTGKWRSKGRINYYQPLALKWYTNTLQLGYVIAFTHIVVLIGCMVHHCVPQRSEDVERARQAQRAIHRDVGRDARAAAGGDAGNKDVAAGRDTQDAGQGDEDGGQKEARGRETSNVITATKSK